MAYEVARVHGLILSHIQDVEKDDTAWLTARSQYQLPRLSPDTSFLYDFPSDVNQFSESSPSSSLESSTETETDSDEEDIIAGLAEQIAHSMLEDDEPNCILGEDVGAIGGGESSDILPSREDAEYPKVVVSPQSSWSTSSLSPSWSESLSSSKQSSQLSSPSSTASKPESDAWDLLNAAAGEVVKLKITDDRISPPHVSVQSSNYTGLCVPKSVKQCGRLTQRPTGWRSHPCPVPFSSSPSCSPVDRLTSPNLGSKERMVEGGGAPHMPRSWSRARDEEHKPCINSQPQHRLSRNDGAGCNQRQTRTAKNPHKGGVNQKLGRPNFGHGVQSRVSGKILDFNGIPQRSGGQAVNAGSGMRAVFLSSAGSGRESGGTGVFLPRCIGGGSEHRRKPACSTVLLPSRIVQVLNLNVEDMRSHPVPQPASLGHSRSDFAGAIRNAPPHMYMMDLTAGPLKYEGVDRTFQGPRLRRHDSVEISLPTEWTY